MLIAQAVASKAQLLDWDTVRQTLHKGLEGQFIGNRVLVLIPDHTRTVPLPKLFRDLVATLHNVHQLDFMVALGTHPPLNESQMCQLVGITPEERQSRFRHIGLLNHAWNVKDTLREIGVIPQDQVREIAGPIWHPSLGGDVPVNINRDVLNYDHIIILGPTFPHEVVGFSGGAKYLFPGISGPEMINVTHWLGALNGVIGTIGVKDTAVRRMIDTAAEFVSTPITLIGLVVINDGLAGVFIGDYLSAWNAAADLSSERHILWFDKPFQRVLSWAPPMYNELWTGAKAMYKLDPVVCDGGEVIIYAPHLEVISHIHGKYISEIGYHVVEYFLKQWHLFQHVPLGILAHSTHVRGAGRFENGIEYPRIDVTLSSRISEAECRQLNLGYLDPARVNPPEWKNREAESILFVPKAGEMLFRVK